MEKIGLLLLETKQKLACKGCFKKTVLVFLKQTLGGFELKNLEEKHLYGHCTMGTSR